MRRAVFRPERRNRNIGPAKQGHGQDNRLVVPDGRHDVRWSDSRLTAAISVDRVINGRTLRFLVEPPRRDSAHACTLDDIAQLLLLLPPSDHEGISVIVLRQPTRKQEILRGAWGRLVWSFGDLGTAIVLDTVSPGTKLALPRSSGPADMAEMDRLREAGFPVVETRRAYELTMTLDAVRALQLFHTLLHEMGHFADHEARRRAGDGPSR